jgi:hypothetical protein
MRRPSSFRKNQQPTARTAKLTFRAARKQATTHLPTQKHLSKPPNLGFVPQNPLPPQFVSQTSPSRPIFDSQRGFRPYTRRRSPSIQTEFPVIRFVSTPPSTETRSRLNLTASLRIDSEIAAHTHRRQLSECRNSLAHPAIALTTRMTKSDESAKHWPKMPSINLQTAIRAAF